MQFTLRLDTRYNFCDIYGKKFRATVFAIYYREASDYKTLCLKHYEHADGTPMGGMVSIPYDWIAKAETLEDILRDDDVLLPSEILLEINALH